MLFQCLSPGPVGDFFVFSIRGERRFDEIGTDNVFGPVHRLPFHRIILLPHALQVDAVSSESTADVRRWRRAQIVEESSTGRLRLSFEALPDYTDEWVSRDSPNIAPPGYVT